MQGRGDTCLFTSSTRGGGGAQCQSKSQDLYLIANTHHLPRNLPSRQGLTSDSSTHLFAWAILVYFLFRTILRHWKS